MKNKKNSIKYKNMYVSLLSFISLKKHVNFFWQNRKLSFQILSKLETRKFCRAWWDLSSFLSRLVGVHTLPYFSLLLYPCTHSSPVVTAHGVLVPIHLLYNSWMPSATFSHQAASWMGSHPANQPVVFLGKIKKEKNIISLNPTIYKEVVFTIN